MKKILCVFLVLLFASACFVSCAENRISGNDDTKKTGEKTDDAIVTTVETAAETEKPTNEEIASQYLEKISDRNLKREFNVLCMQNVGNSEKEIWVENASTEPIDNAVFMRNAAVFEKLGVTINKVAVTSPSAAAQNDQKSNAHEYDLIMANGPETGALAQAGYLYNFLDMSDILNLDCEWWDPGTIRDCAINGKVYFMNGDINILDNDVTWILMFNKKMIVDNDLEEPYELVKSGNWTLDKFYELITTVSKDNGDSIYDEHDTYGFITTNGGGLTNFMYTCDVTTVKVIDGTPKIVMGDYQEKIVKILEWVKKAIHEDHYTWISQNNPAQTKEMFMNNQALFYSEVLSYIVNLSDMETDFGVLPTPKFDAEQKEYRTHVDGVGSMISIPANITDPEETATIIETMALYSYMYVTPAYYDVTLKRKKSRDSESYEMIDIILQSRVYDIGYIYSDTGLSTTFQNLAAKGNTNFASAYKTVKTRAERRIEKIVEKYNSL